MRRSVIAMMAVALMAPCSGGAAPNIKGRSDLNEANAGYAIANLEFREAAFDIYQKRNFNSINQLLQAIGSPRSVFGKSDSKAYLADYLYQQRELSDILQILVGGRLSEALLSKDETEVVIADLYITIGLPKSAEQLLRRLSTKRTAASRHSWLALARYYYRHGDLQQTEQALSNLQNLPMGELQAEQDSLSALVFLADNRDKEAIAVLKGGSEQGQGNRLSFDRYNLGLAYLNQGRLQEGATAFARLYESAGASPATLPLRDLADVTLGYTLLDKQHLDQAAALLQDYAQSDALSSYALLGAGWAASLKGDYRKALELWLPLTERAPGDAAVQEGMMAVPHAYYQLQDYTQALNYYRRAIDGYQRELLRVRGARDTVSDGSFLSELMAINAGGKDFDALWRAEKLPVSPINHYLLPTLTSHRFQEALKNYRDLLVAQELLARYGDNIDASLDLLARQQPTLGSRRQQIEQINSSLDSAALAARAQKIREDLERAEANHEVMAFATVNQKKLLFSLKQADKLLDKLKNYIVDHDDLQAKYELLRGLMIWDLTQQYPERLSEVKRQMRELEVMVTKLKNTQALLNRSVDQINGAPAKQESTYMGLRAKQASLLATAQSLTGKQQEYLEKQLIRGLEDGEKRLLYSIRQARFGIAQTIDQVITASPNKDYGPAIAAYQTVLDQGGEAPFRREMMFRLAYLKILQADYYDADKTAAAAKNSGHRNDTLYGEAIAILTRLLKDYPNSSDNDRILYNLARAYDHRGETDTLLDTLERFARDFPRSAHIDEMQFRRGELLFSLGLPAQAGEAYGAIVAMGADSPFYEKALYKLGWSQYKEGRYEAAVDTFLPLLGHKLSPAAADTGAADPDMTRGEKELVNDIQRGAILSIAQLKGVESLNAYFTLHGEQPYEYRLFEVLAQLYLEQERIEDAATAYRAFVARHPNDPRAPQFDSKMLAAYEKGRFIDLVLSAKEDFINRYRPDSAYWAENPNIERDGTLKQVRDYLHEVTRYSHAKAQRSKAAPEYLRAENWYRLFLKSFPQDPLASEMHFLFAELLYEAQDYQSASQEYAKVAYELKDSDKAAEAAYAAALAQDKLAASLSDERRRTATQQSLIALQRFAETFPNDSRAAAALSKTAQEWFALNDYARAESAAQRLLAMKPDGEMRRSAWSILGHSQFEGQRYGDAERSYQQVLSLMTKGDAQRRDLEENLAAAVYKQGEQARAGGDDRGAAQHFLRIADMAPTVSIVATAQYDAAAALLAVEDWRAAIQILERFRVRYPDNPLKKELAPKLAVAYQKVGDWTKAATELETIAAQGENDEFKRDAVWQSAELYLRAGQTQEAQRVFQDYVRRFPKPAAEAIEARQRLAELYAQQNDPKQHHYWLQQLIDADDRAGAERSDRTRLLAGRAALVLADVHYQAYAALKLKNPLKKSLALKKKAMEVTLADYRAAGKYGIAEITTAATYRTAQIYSDLGRALLDSERPKGLSALEIEQYNVLLEEQAYPFEEQAIALYEANARRVTENIYDDSVKKSFSALSKLLPGRYAKTEKGEAYVDGIY